MGKAKSFKSKAVHFVSDLTTVSLNPLSVFLSDSSTLSLLIPPSSLLLLLLPLQDIAVHFLSLCCEDLSEPKRSQLESINEEENEDLVDGSDTSSFTAFLYSLLSSSDSGDNSNADEKNDNTAEMVGHSSEIVTKESVTRKGLLSRGKQSLRAIYQAGITGGYQSQGCKGESDLKLGDESNDNFDGLEIKHTQIVKEPVELGDLPSVSEPSLLLSERARSALYASRPALAQGRKWLLLYSVERGANRHFTLCSTDFLAMGWGGHFALYLDGDLLNGSSSVSETYGNPCLAHSADFEVKEVE